MWNSARTPFPVAGPGWKETDSILAGFPDDLGLGAGSRRYSMSDYNTWKAIGRPKTRRVGGPAVRSVKFQTAKRSPVSAGCCKSSARQVGVRSMGFKARPMGFKASPMGFKAAPVAVRSLAFKPGLKVASGIAGYEFEADGLGKFRLKKIGKKLGKLAKGALKFAAPIAASLALPGIASTAGRIANATASPSPLFDGVPGWIGRTLNRNKNTIANVLNAVSGGNEGDAGGQTQGPPMLPPPAPARSNVLPILAAAAAVLAFAGGS